MGSKFTTSAWGSGTIPLTALDVWLSKTGSPTGNITAKLYNAAGGSVLATADTTINAATGVTSNAMKLRFVFTDEYGLATNTSYIIAILYGNGDASNYIKVHGVTQASGGDCYYYDGSWHNDATIDMSLGVKPGLPPKGKFGDVKDLRFFVAGGSDNPGHQYFSNINTVLDWSSQTSILSTNEYDTDGGGYVGAIDDDANAYSIGAIIAFWGDLFIFGTKKQPFLSKLIGKTPNQFSLPPLYQHIHTTYKTVQGLPNDVWFTSDNSVHNIAGIKEYGDIRTASPGDTIKNKIVTYYDENAFAGYNPADGQYLVKLTGYDNILVCHTAQSLEGRYVWTEYKPKGLTPTAFGTFNGYFYIGCSNGHLYRLDDTLVADDGDLPDIELKTGIQVFPFQTQSFSQLFINAVSEEGATGTLSFYKNSRSKASWHKAIEVDDLPIQKRIQYSCDALQLYLHDLVYTKPVTFGGILLK
jgi:hypothetical protein